MSGAVKTLRAAAFGCALMLTGSACAGLVRAGSHATTTPKSSACYGCKVSNIPDIRVDKPKPGAKTGVLNVKVLDNNNRALAGAIVRYKGPQKGQATTDSTGQVHVSLKPGTYVIDLAPCGTTIIPKTQQSAEAVIVAGLRSPVGYLSGIAWVRRFAPADQGRVSKAPPWKVGQTIDVGIAVQDGCTYGLAKNLAMPTLQWSTSSDFAFVATPSYRTDSTGFVDATVKCITKGKGLEESIKLYDRADPKSYGDIILATSSPPAGHDWCE